jgi:hypothetical protein
LDDAMSGAGEGNEVRKILAQFDAPAFVRRAKAVEVSDELLHTRCSRQREEWLEMPRLRLGQFAAALGDWSRWPLSPGAGHDPQPLIDLHSQWQPRLKVPVPQAQSAVQLETPWTRLTASFAKFNSRWQAYVEKFPRDEINEIRDGYNRYYVLEKECATGSPALARRGFVELPPVTVQTLLQWYPLLPVFTLT